MCTSVYTYIRTPSRLFVCGGSQIESAEGATEGDTWEMPVYSIGITPLLQKVNNDISIKHVAYADDLG